MSKLAGLGAGPVMGVTGVAAVVIGGALYLTGVIGPQAVTPEDIATQDNVTPESAALQPAETKPESSSEENVAATHEPELLLPDAPSIDTFRLEPDGTMLVAGQATAGWRTSIVVDGVPLTEVAVGSDGKFVNFLTLEPSEKPRILSLVMMQDGSDEALVSSQDIIIAPMAAHVLADADTAATANAQTNTVANAEVSQTDELGDATEADVQAVPDSAAPTAQAILLADDSGVQVLQPAVSEDQAPEVMSSVALDAISYSQEGEVQLAGRGQGTGFVRVYLDNAPVITSRISAGGNWRTELPEVDTGVYTLRIDEVAEDGTVTSRVETPFKREDETLIAQSTEADLTQTRIAAITVQPGSTLWAISRETYGDGVMYVRVFEANKDRIRDPDLIFPGQVFTLPE